MAESNSQEPADRDRLFVRPIIDVRARGLFKENLQALCEASTEERWSRVFDRPEDEPELDPKVMEVYMELLADVEAWVVVEHARQASKARRR